MCMLEDIWLAVVAHDGHRVLILLRHVHRARENGGTQLPPVPDVVRVVDLSKDVVSFARKGDMCDQSYRWCLR